MINVNQQTKIINNHNETFSLKNDIVFKNNQHIYVQFKQPRLTISSAVYNGGMFESFGFLNLKVNENDTHYLPPAETISNYCRDNQFSAQSIGMMTSASMNSFRLKESHSLRHPFYVLITCGLSNARRAGDPTTHLNLESHAPLEEKSLTTHSDNRQYTPGTINIAAIFHQKLSHACLVEAIGIIAEAKAATLQKLNILSPVSNKLATGTGTDATAVFNGFGEKSISYCGKHTELGELLANAIITALESSITRQLSFNGAID